MCFRYWNNNLSMIYALTQGTWTYDISKHNPTFSGFWNCVQNGEIGMIQYFITKLPGNEHFDKLEWTFAHIIAYGVHPDLIRYHRSQKQNLKDTIKVLQQVFIKNEYALFKFSKFGNLPIHLACQINNSIVLQLMIDTIEQQSPHKLETMLNMCKKDKYWQQTPLMIAIRYNSLECVKILCDQDVVIDNLLAIKSRYPKYNALQFALVNSTYDSSILKMLLTRIAKRHLVLNENETHDTRVKQMKQLKSRLSNIIDTTMDIMESLLFSNGSKSSIFSVAKNGSLKKDKDNNKKENECKLMCLHGHKVKKPFQVHGACHVCASKHATFVCLHCNQKGLPFRYCEKCAIARNRWFEIVNSEYDNESMIISMMSNEIKDDSELVPRIYQIEQKMSFQMMEHICNFGLCQLLDFLLENGIDVNKVCNKNIFKLIVGKNDQRVIDLLIKYEFDFGQNFSEYFFWICSGGSLTLLNYYFVQYTSKSNMKQIKSETDDSGNNGLHLSVQNQQLSTVEFLLENVYFPNGNANDEIGKYALNRPNNDGYTPAILCLSKPSPNSLAIFKLLLKYKCKLTPIGSNKMFPLYAASFYNHISILKYMIDNNVATDTINTIGDSAHLTPLMIAILENNAQAVQILCFCDKIDIDDTSLTYGTISGNAKILKLLLRALLKQHRVIDWESFQNAGIDRKIIHLKKVMFQSNDAKLKGIRRRRMLNDKCKLLLEILIKKGINPPNYRYIACRLRYNVTNLVEQLPNDTVFVEYKYNSANVKIPPSGQSKVVSRWRIGEILGRGTFGDVLKGLDINDGLSVALKFISVNKLSKNSKSRKKTIVSFILNELETLELIDHDNVIKLLAYNLNVNNNGTMLLVFEYAQYGELYQFLSINKYFNLKITKTYFEQILNALESCHNIGILHRDLKPQNILVDGQYQVKIADFGLSTYDNDITNKNALYVGTRGYMSPEIASPMIVGWDNETDKPIFKEVKSSCDIFSLGVILWQMLNGIESMPFDEATTTDAKYYFIRASESNVFWKCHRNARIVQKEYKAAKDLLLKMFTFNPDYRINVNEIRNHQFYKDTLTYNNDAKSQKFFQQAMGHIHSQLKQKQQSAIKNVSRYLKSSAITRISAEEDEEKSKITLFEFEKLRSSYFSVIKPYTIINPLIVMMIIGDYSNSSLPTITTAYKDYQNVIQTFNVISGYQVVFAQSLKPDSNNNNHNDSELMIKRLCDKDPMNSRKNYAKSRNYKVKWTLDEIEEFHKQTKQILMDNKNNNSFDSLIFVLSCHGNGNEIYDSNGDSLGLGFIYHEYDNTNCRELRNKPKIYLFDTIKSGNTSNNNTLLSNTNCNFHADVEVASVVTPGTNYTEIDENTGAVPQLTAKVAATYTKHSHFRKIFGHSAKQPMVKDSIDEIGINQFLKNGSIFVHCLAIVFKNRSKDANLTDILHETRKFMAKILRLPNENPDGVVLRDDSTMPYQIEFDTLADEYDAKIYEKQNAEVMEQTDVGDNDTEVTSKMLAEHQSLFKSNMYLSNYQTNFGTPNVDLSVGTKNNSNSNSESNKLMLMTNPLIAMIGISEYDSGVLPNLECVVNDYKNVEHAFHIIRGYSFIHLNKQNKIVHKINNKNNNTATVGSRQNLKLKWSDDEILNFNNKIHKILENNKYRYDGLIYFISCHGDSGGIIYDSNGNKLPLIAIYDQFNNQNCLTLRNKPKIYFVEACRGDSRTKRYENSLFNSIGMPNQGSSSIATTQSSNNYVFDNYSNAYESETKDDLKKSSIVTGSIVKNNDSRSNSNSMSVLFSKYNYNREIYANTEGFAVVEPDSKGAYMTRSITQAIQDNNIFKKDFDTIMNHVRKIMLKLMGQSVECAAQVIEDHNNVPRKMFFKS